MSQELLIATRNRGKVAEFARLIDGLPVVTRDLAEFSEAGEAEETGATFEENATLKARFYAGETGLMTLADDSGLEVDALGGAPGVYSARYAGPEATDAERNALLLRELSEAGAAERRARFVCVLALVEPSVGTVRLFRGVCEGGIAFRPSGEGGFGYDPLFIPEGYDRTFGELPADVKNSISHRARALRLAKEYLMTIFTP